MQLRTLLGVVTFGTWCAVCVHAQVIVQRPDIQQLGRSSPPPLIAPIGAQFDVVSIKVNDTGAMGGGGELLPDGTQRFINRPVANILAAAAPGAVDEVNRDGLPDWTKSERYDIIAKPPPDSHPTAAQRREMMRNMLIERFKVAGHIEEQPRNGFALVLARRDGRLGPHLTKSKLDCEGVDADRCGGQFAAGMIEMDGASLNHLASRLRGDAGGPVTNRTGLAGDYDIRLRFSADPTAPPDDAPSIFTAVQEQLGLKLVPEKTKVKVFVIDHIERPTPND